MTPAPRQRYCIDGAAHLLTNAPLSPSHYHCLGPLPGIARSFPPGDLHSALTQIFLGLPIDDDALEACVKTFRLRYSRDLLVLILKQPSNVRKGLLKSGSFEALVKMSIGVLDACVKHDDVTTAWGVLSIAEFYYREVPRRAMKVKDKLQGRLRDHRMWQRLSLWENAFVQARQSDIIRGKRSFETDIVSCCSELIFLMLSLGGSERMAHMFVKRVAQVRLFYLPLHFT